MSGCTHTPRQDARQERPEEPAAVVERAEGVRPKIRSSKSGRWRALALVVVHLFIAVHVAHWMTTGTTLAPLEPSEGMQLGIQGVVNAGLIFFALTIVSTFVMGRWFCGWACHVVALQDGCRWLLGKVGIRPRMVNLGLLGIVPLLAFAYMFLMPIVRRLMHGQGLGVHAVHIYTQDFWKTFPSWPVALLTFAVCGFVIVYFLGAKGFCNYGCPYGAVFGIADQFAPFRIRVTDACEGCGHCTAVCSSNVKVHQEVRDFGMVVDPGCMKCLDCVSVCPKDALYAGFGAPAIVAKLRTPPAQARRKRPAERTSASAGSRSAGSLSAESRSAETRTAETRDAGSRDAGSRGAGLARWALLAAFVLGTYTVLMAYNGEVAAYVNPPEWNLIAVMTALSLGVVFLFRGKARRTAEYSLAEEAMLGLAFLGAMLAFRGLHGVVPLLFAFGLSALFSWASVQAWRLLTSGDARIQRVVLKREGRWRPAGFVFAAVMALAFSGLALAMHEQAGLRRGGKATMERLLVAEGMRLSGAQDPEETVRTFERALRFDASSLDARRGLASALFQSGRRAEGLAHLEAVLAADPTHVPTQAQMAAALVASGDVERALAHLREAIRLAPDRGDLRLFLADVLDELGLASEAARERARARVGPGSSPP